MEIINSARGASFRRRGTGQQVAHTGPLQAVEHLRLERAFGCGTCNAGLVTCQHPSRPGVIAYSSGSVVVIYDSNCKTQTTFLCPKSRHPGKPYACLAFSKDGAYLAAGERGGQSPELLVWEVSSGRCLQGLRGHKNGVGSITFSQDGRLLVSTGEAYDGQLCVWDWQTGTLLAKQHTQAEVQRACIVEDGTGMMITTIGKAGRSGHFKAWLLSLPSGRQPAPGQVTLMPRPANLKEYRNSSFVGIAVAPAEGTAQQGQPLLYALTQEGILLTLRSATRTIDKSTNLNVSAAFSLAVSQNLVACACAAGVVRLFATRTLAFKGNLPRLNPRGAGTHPAEAPGGSPAPAGSCASAQSPIVAGTPCGSGAGFAHPDATGCAFDCSGEKLTVAYADRTLMIWDMRNPSRPTRSRSVLSHSGVIWSAALIPAWQAPLLSPPTESPTSRGNEAVSGPSSILCTCGADGTVRLWNVCLDNSASTAGPMGVPAEPSAAARVTRTLRATIYADPPEADEDATVFNNHHRRCAPEAPLPAPDSRAGVGQQPRTVTLRCLRVSPCGRHLATGDTRGNLRVYNLATLELLLFREAHDLEIMSLDYSPPSLDGSCYLASGSRDMFIHVYDMSRGYDLVGTCDAHTAAVTAVRFSSSGGRLALLSCSADKSVVFRRVQLDPCGLTFEVYNTERIPRGVLYDIAVDPTGGRAVAVGQGNQLRVFDVATGRGIGSFSGDASCGEAVSVTMDPTGHMAVCSCNEGGVAVYDVDTGALLARGSGHGDVCTGAVLLDDYRGLVSVGGDGCALLWRLTPKLGKRMQDAVADCQRQLEAQARAQAAMVQQREQHKTPCAVSRRKAWGTCDAAGDAAEEIKSAAAEGMELRNSREVHIDMSVTVLRVRQGKALLSADKLPRWARVDEEEEASQGGDPSRLEQEPAAAPAPLATASPPIPVIAQLPAGKWAQRPAPPVFQLDPTAAEEVAAQPDALAVQPRTWAEEVEGDDEIVFCDPSEDGQTPGEPRGFAQDAQDVAPEVDMEAGGAAAGDGFDAALCVPRPDGDGDDVIMETGEDEETCWEGSQLDDLPLQEETASLCASNRLAGAGQPGEATGGVKGVLRRDLFREHFDSLGIDQGSATKALAADPRRQSLSLWYRQARAGSIAGGPLSAVIAASARPALGGGAGAAPMAATAAVGPLSPFLAAMPLPASINTKRGGGAVGMDVDGAVTSSAWTPDRGMLPLFSPAHVKADKQAEELDRMIQRVKNSIAKRPAYAGAPVAPSPLGAAPTSGAAFIQPALTPRAAAATAALAAAAAASMMAATPRSRAGVAPPAPAAVAAPDAAVMAAGQPGPQATAAGIGFKLPPSHAILSAAAARQKAAAAAEAEAAAAEPAVYTAAPTLPVTPGLSDVSGGSCMPEMGDVSGSSTPVSGQHEYAPNGTTGEEALSSALLMSSNPLYGANPATPMLGGAMSAARHRAATMENVCPSIGTAATSATGVLLASHQGVSASSQPAPSAEDVLRSILQEQQQPAASSADGTGVCIVSQLTAAGNKLQKQFLQTAVAPDSDVLMAGGQEQQRRQPKVPLPAVKPRANSPAKSTFSASAAVEAAAESPTIASFTSTHAQEPPVQADDGAVSQEVPLEDAASGADADPSVRLLQALRLFVNAYTQVNAAPATASCSSSASLATAARYQEVAERAVAELTAMLQGRDAPEAHLGLPRAGTQKTAEPEENSPFGKASGTATTKQQALDDVSVPPVETCMSPRMGAEAQPQPRGLRSGAGSSVMDASAALLSGSVRSGLSSGQVVQVDRVGSLVEDLLHQRMEEEMKKMKEKMEETMEDMISQRIRAMMISSR